MLTPRYRALSQLFGNWATSLEAGLGLEQAVKLSQRTLSAAAGSGTAAVALERVRDGASLPDALEQASGRWPLFVIPVLQAGERSGRMDQALRYLEDHCRLLHGPAAAMQRAWLYPLGIMLAGTVVRLAGSCWLRPWPETFWLLLSALKNYGTLACFVAMILLPLFRPLVDPIKLALPLVGPAERELAVNRFFSVMAMLYATGGRRVEAMVRLACRTVANVVIRDDLLCAAQLIEEGCTISESFQPMTRLQPAEQELIASGELSGTLGKSLDRIANQAAESLQIRLRVFTEIAVRVTILVVSMSIALTLLSFVM